MKVELAGLNRRLHVLDRRLQVLDRHLQVLDQIFRSNYDSYQTLAAHLTMGVYDLHETDC